jgi:hypothetical protein
MAVGSAPTTNSYLYRREPSGRTGTTTLTSGSGLDENSFAAPRKIAPQESQLPVAAAKFSHAFSASSLTVLRLAFLE